MYLSILALQNQSTEIHKLREAVNTYFYRQINDVIAHYKEELAYNHLAQLQYHIDLVLGAYCHKELAPALAYDFLLNTKYIALETSYLLKEQKERPLYSAKQVMQQLAEDTVFLEYTSFRILDKKCYGVFLISRNQISYKALGELEEIDALVVAWRRLMQASVSAIGKDAEQILAEQQRVNMKLRRTLYLPIKEALLPGQGLLIAPAGSLVEYPFSQMPVSARETLGDQHFISYLNTGKELLYEGLASGKRSYQDKKALIVGNPTGSKLPNLPFAEAEADMVAYHLKTLAYKRDEANFSNIIKELDAAPKMMHIAAHGVYQAPMAKEETDWDRLYEAMTNSGIFLAEDTLLSCAQIGQMNLDGMELAVLSCCHSGEGTYLTTEGAYGLRRSIALAGCSAMIVSLWQVDDAASFLWMKAFYEALILCKEPVKEAFTIAVNSVKNYEENGVHPYANPYYWAGFILISV